MIFVEKETLISDHSYFQYRYEKENGLSEIRLRGEKSERKEKRKREGERERKGKKRRKKKERVVTGRATAEENRGAARSGARDLIGGVCLVEALSLT